jgi:hypothetical protein
LACDLGTQCTAQGYINSLETHDRKLKTGSTRRLTNHGLEVVAQANGPVLLSINGKGHAGSDTIGVMKPSGTAVVRTAFLFATTITADQGMQGIPADVKLNGVQIEWDGMKTNSFLGSFYKDVTTIVKDLIDSSDPGELFIDVEEVSNIEGTDGEILAVIFEDPTADPVPDNSIALLFGALDSEGDSFDILLENPITQANIDDPNLVIDLSLGIGFGFQGPVPGTRPGSAPTQFSRVVSG